MLSNRFRLLKSGSKAALPRQQTLRAALDWSYDLLSAEERNLYNRISVFAGGCTLEAAAAVSSQPDEDACLEALTSLVDKSLVIYEVAATLGCLSTLACRRGAWEAATCLGGFAGMHGSSESEEIRTMHDMLGETAFQAARVRGARMTMAEAIDCALSMPHV